MSTTQTQTSVLRCSICHKEIPHNKALTVESKEYAYHFCGQGCFVEWEQKNPDSNPPPPPEQ